jgi:LacI family transcriptional regulator
LSRGKSDTLGLVVPDITNPYFARLAAAVEREAARQGYGLTLCASLNTQEREREYLGRLSRMAVDGVIFVTNHADDGALAEPIAASSRRIVILDEDVAGVRASKVFSDNEQGGYLAGRHLVEAGHRRLAFLGGPEHMMSTRARLAGYRRAVAEAAPHAEISTTLFGDYSVAHARRAAEELIARKDRATAVFVSSDEIAIGALEIFAREGISIPQQLSVIGFDDVAPFHLFNPPLTCVRQPVEEMGRRAVELLVSGMAGASMKTTVERLPVELILRGSVASPAQAMRNRPHREGKRHV